VEPPKYPKVGVVALTTDPWHVEWMHSRHHFLSRLAQHFQVVWMEPSVYWRATLQREKSSAPVFAGLADNPGMTVYRQEFLRPLVFRPEWLGRALLRARVRRAAAYLRKQGCEKLVLYLWNPRFGPALDACRWDLTCYHIDDEYTYSAVEMPNSQEEVDIITRADQVFIHSNALMEKKGRNNPSSMHIPNGVNFSWFGTAVPIPPDLAKIPRPWIGYTGFVKKQLDWDLLCRLSARHPNWSFVFVGQVSPHAEIKLALEEMAAKKNVFFLGPKPASVAATYPQHFDVCIMPYVLNDYTKYIYPLKLHEYLAGGQPVVSTPIPAVRPFSHVLRLASTEQEWSDEISASLSSESNQDSLKQARQAVAKEYDWDVLVARLAQTLSARLGLNS
jgi:glycosyltransferase involved in cell wall biosynthesis